MNNPSRSGGSRSRAGWRAAARVVATYTASVQIGNVLSSYGSDRDFGIDIVATMCSAFSHAVVPVALSVLFPGAGGKIEGAKRAAAVLSLKPRTLRYRMDKLGGTLKNSIRGIFRIGSKDAIFALLHFSNNCLFEKWAAYPYAAGHFELIEVPLGS